MPLPLPKRTVDIIPPQEVKPLTGLSRTDSNDWEVWYKGVLFGTLDLSGAYKKLDALVKLDESNPMEA